MDDAFDDINYLKMFFLVVFCGVIIYASNYFYPDVKWFFPPSIVVIAGVLAFIGSGKWVIWKSRYISDQFFCNGVHGSIYGDPIPVKDPLMGDDWVWAVIRLGYSFPFTRKGKLAVAIVPWSHLHKCSSGLSSLDLVHKFPVRLLTPALQSFYRRNQDDFNWDKLYFGFVSQDFVDKSGDFNSLASQVKVLSALNSQYEQTIEHDFGSFESVKELSDRLNDRKGFLRSIVERVKSVGKEEE